jgi:hypothetical protein
MSFEGVLERELQQARGAGVPQGEDRRYLCQHLLLLATSGLRSAPPTPSSGTFQHQVSAASLPVSLDRI